MGSFAGRENILQLHNFENMLKTTTAYFERLDFMTYDLDPLKLFKIYHKHFENA